MNRKVEFLLKEPKEKLYEYFIHTVADRLEVWGIFDDKENAWVCEKRGLTTPVVLFPEQEFTEAWRFQDKFNEKAKSVNLYEFIYEWGSCFKKNDKVSLYGSENALLVNAKKLIEDINTELDNY